jgi:hypothetical protein
MNRHLAAVLRRPVVALTFIASPCLPRVATAQRPATIVAPDGRTIEVLGLRRWTIAMLQDSLGRYAPSDSLQSHSCAVTLRYRLGFADAAVMEFVPADDSPSRIVVAVREPQDSGRVRYRAMPLDSLHARPAWLTANRVLDRRPDLFWRAADAALSGVAVRASPSHADSATVDTVRRFLRSHIRDRDRRDALAALERAPNANDRIVAAVLLGQFAARDDSWWALATTLRETDGFVRSGALRVLTTLSRSRPRRVAWASAAPGVHALLDGTSLYMLREFAAVLSRTGVGPADAPALLKGGGEMLIDYAASGTPLLAEPTHALLVQLRGADLGREAAPWRAWVAGL